jgi:hypothetical protein
VLQTANQSYASILGCFQNSFDIRQKKKKKIQDEKKKLLSALAQWVVVTSLQQLNSWETC